MTTRWCARAIGRCSRSTRACGSWARRATPPLPISSTRSLSRTSSSWTSRCRGAAASTQSSTSAAGMRRRAFSYSPCTRTPPTRCRLSAPEPAATSPRAARPSFSSAPCATLPPAASPSVRRSSELLAFNQVREEKARLEDLSPREFEIFRMILEARSTDDIAAALNVSRKTAANYHYTIKSKLGAASDIELLHFGLRQGLVAPVLPPADGSHGHNFRGRGKCVPVPFGAGPGRPAVLVQTRSPVCRCRCLRVSGPEPLAGKSGCRSSGRRPPAAGRS